MSDDLEAAFNRMKDPDQIAAAASRNAATEEALKRVVPQTELGGTIASDSKQDFLTEHRLIRQNLGQEKILFLERNQPHKSQRLNRVRL
jgi:hypothetical protein